LEGARGADLAVLGVSTAAETVEETAAAAIQGAAPAASVVEEQQEVPEEAMA